MTEFSLLLSEPILRDASPMQTFLQQIDYLVRSIIFIIAGPTNGNSVVNNIMSEPMLLFPIGIVAIMGTIGILKRLLSRD